jgi:hypothetical protein
VPLPAQLQVRLLRSTNDMLPIVLAAFALHRVTSVDPFSFFSRYC